jgi:hypothetical protein
MAVKITLGTDGLTGVVPGGTYSRVTDKSDTDQMSSK